eukprot:TRINITY_DN36713_c1_g2_i2.p1 TRINITY_DN36713_c1_g2~~TRINITY_DN36713_c1_g2_i2.p1  ORF type:complete len:431 (+),score=28.66 TRINITY_DN36713_c1_g2_i2:292-1584(+)
MTTPVVYFVLLFHWQTIRAACLRRRMMPSTPRIFLDKLCINQENEDEKQKGILGLAAFLKKSDRMVLLWSNRYFTRLWCTYELSTWLSLGKDASSIVFLPVQVPKLIVAMTGSCTVYTVVLQAARLLPSLGFVQFFDRLEMFVFRIALVVVMGAVCTYRLQSLQLELTRLCEHLAAFSMLDAECFCCSNGHEHPATHAKLPCDRRLVYRTLKSWHPKEDMEQVADNAFISAFDTKVRTFLRDVMISIVSSDASLLTYTEVIHAVLPVFWVTLDVGLNFIMNETEALRVLCEYCQGVFTFALVAPCQVTLWLHLLAKAPRWCCRIVSPSMRLFYAMFLWGPVFAAMSMLLWLPLQLALRRGAVWAQFLWALLLAGCLRCMRRSKAGRLSEGGPALRGPPDCVADEAGVGLVQQPLGKSSESSEPPENIVRL